MTLPVPGDQGAAPGPAAKDNADLIGRIQALERRLEEMQRKTLANTAISDGELLVQGTGGIRVIDADGDESLFIGGYTGDLARPDGQPQRVFVLRDDNGNARLALWDPNPTGDGYQQAIYTWDHLDHIALSTDVNGGLAEPWLPIYLYPKFNNATATWSYMTIDNGLIHSEKQVWEGRIVHVTHPRLQLSGVWGIGGGTSSTPIYRLKINGTVVDSWSQSTISAGQRDPIDISAWLGDKFATIELTVQASTGTGAAIAAQVLGCALRQT